MTELVFDRIAWRRRGRRREYLGTLAAGESGIRLSGRDASSGVNITLSIPPTEVEGAHVSRTVDETLDGERAVVLELVESDPILLREVGTGPLHAHALARRLAAVPHRAAERRKTR